jgi:hypothetical protein
MKPSLKAPGTKRMTQKCDELLSTLLKVCFNFASILLQFCFNFAFSFNLRRYASERDAKFAARDAATARLDAAAAR